MSKHKQNANAAPPEAAGNLVFLRLGQLKTHPQNMRKFYPVDQVKEMAQSIRGYGGLVNALVVTPDGEANTFYVIDGNMRLAGGRFIGEDCPPLKAEIVSQERAQQLLTMVIANTVRYAVDPISEALHYKALREAEGLTIGDIAERTGVYAARVHNRLELLKVDGAIQKLMAEDQLPIDKRVVDAFLSVPDVEVRVKLAERLAYRGARIKTIEAACAKVVESMAEAARAAEGALADKCPRCEMAFSAENPKMPAGHCSFCEAETPTPSLPQHPPMVGLALERSEAPEPGAEQAIPMPEIRTAAAAMCGPCEVRLNNLGGRAAEPAWALITHAAGETCDNCNLREVAGACSGCPGVEMLRRLVTGITRAREVEIALAA